jgi:hypothetical protein
MDLKPNPASESGQLERSVSRSHPQAARISASLLFVVLVSGCSSAVKVTRSGAPVAQAVELTGTWQAEDVAYAPWIFSFKRDADKLMGTVSQGHREFTNPLGGRFTNLTMPVGIRNGLAKANTISFKCFSPGPGDRTVTFVGELNGSEIAFTRSVQVRPGGDPGEDGIYGASGASHFVARRITVNK